MNLLGKNRKTTILGLLTIVGGAVHAGVSYSNGQPVDIMAFFAAVSAGLGLIFAKDSATHSTPQEIGLMGTAKPTNLGQ